ncbi:uncharacterized protein LOC103796371 isoform X2 [Callithrix jacchus]
MERLLYARDLLGALQTLSQQFHEVVLSLAVIHASSPGRMTLFEFPYSSRQCRVVEGDAAESYAGWPVGSVWGRKELGAWAVCVLATCCQPRHGPSTFSEPGAGDAEVNPETWSCLLGSSCQNTLYYSLSQGVALSGPNLRDSWPGLLFGPRVTLDSGHRDLAGRLRRFLAPWVTP